MTHLIFGRAGVKSKVRREKRMRKRKEIHQRLIVAPSCTRTWPPWRRWRNVFNAITKGGVWSLEDATHAVQKRGRLQLTTSVNHFYFLSIFILVKRWNCFSFKLIITKKTMMKKQKNPWILNFFSFKGNDIISLCNHSINIPKNLLIATLVLLFLKVFNDWFTPQAI